MARDPAASIRRALVALALLAGLWAVVVALTGGFRITLAGIRVSSRSTANPMLVALIGACVVIGLSLRSGANWRAQVHEDLRWWADAVHLRSIGWLHPATLTAFGGALLRLQDWAGGRPLWLDLVSFASPDSGASRRRIIWRLTYCWALVALLVDRARILHLFGLRYADEDVVIFWYACEEFRRGIFREPRFFGQSYGSLFESLIAVPLTMFGLDTPSAVAASAALIGLVPWILLSLMAIAAGRKRTAIATLVLPLILSIEFSLISTSARGFMPGILFATIGAFFLRSALLPKGATPSRGALAMFAFCSAFGLSLNPNAALIVGPVLMVIISRHVRPSDWGKWLPWLLLGAIVPAMLHLMAARFYLETPGYSMHPNWPLRFEVARLTSVLWHQDQFWKDIAPFMLPTGATVVLALMGLPIIAYRQRKWPTFWGALFLLTATLASIGITKVHDGSTSVFFPYARMFLGLPFIAVLLTFGLDLKQRRRPYVLVGLAVGFVALFVGRQIILRPRIEQAARASEVVTPWERAKLTEECTSEYALAHLYGQIPVVHLSERIHAYACQALHYGEHETLYPSYERRTWRLHEESRIARSAALLAHPRDSFCNERHPELKTCTHLDEKTPTVLIEFEPQPLVPLLRKLGIEVRPF